MVHEKLNLFFTEHRKWYDAMNHELHKYIFDNITVQNDSIRRMLTVHAMHQKVFPQFKNTLNGKSVVIIGAGPTVNDFRPELMQEDCVYVSLNRAFKFDKVKFDYLFCPALH